MSASSTVAAVAGWAGLVWCALVLLLLIVLLVDFAVYKRLGYGGSKLSHERVTGPLLAVLFPLVAIALVVMGSATLVFFFLLLIGS